MSEHTHDPDKMMYFPDCPACTEEKESAPMSGNLTSKKRVDDSIPAVLRRRLKELRGDGYNFEFCRVFERAAEALERGPVEPPGDPPCDHDSMTPCPPQCAEAKEQWRRKAAAHIAQKQRAAVPPSVDLHEVERLIQRGEIGDALSLIQRVTGAPSKKPSRPTVDELRDEIRAKKGIPPKYTEPVMPMLPNDKHPGHGCSCRECLRRYPETKSVPHQYQQGSDLTDRCKCGDPMFSETHACPSCGKSADSKQRNGCHTIGCTFAVETSPARCGFCDKEYPCACMP